MVAVGRNFRPFYPQEPNRNRNFHRRLRGLDQAMFRETSDAQTHFDRLPDLYLGLKKENYMRACCGSAGRFSSPVIWRSGGHFSLTKPKCSFIVAYNRCCILFHEAVYSATAKMKSVPFGAANPAKDTKGPAAAVFAHRSRWRNLSAPFLCSAAMELSNEIASYTPVPTGGATVASSFFLAV